MFSDSGLILVKYSSYGRTDNNTCGINWHPSDSINTSCSLKISTIADRCNGLRVCEVKTASLGTPDPCYGTYKYYNTTYECINGPFADKSFRNCISESPVICERGYSTLDCGTSLGDGTIQIINANYGRADSVTCSSGLSDSLIENTNCYAPNTFSTVATLCNGQSRCAVEASYNVFTDPCSETVKYLTVSYMCTSKCEGKSSCEIPATNNFFSDPCVGTFKYLTIAYSCI
ncbi:hypothetical protein QTP70_034630 [Hemibagrus guttatus]|uniref:SUEL-type lectin domain-containing protein n=1 Tax=Hemibagrus guttatus TaxID=175788 RepID=A0AAE0V848_9TELE|nr:hypothetical protein QTP70_034630 [Hemibagrus guttatus]